MCIKCHAGLSDETIIKQLTDDLSLDKFTGWNETSINHLALVYLGVNGEKARELSSELLDKYIFWKENNKNTDDDCLFGEPSADYVRKVKSNLNEIIANKTVHNQCIEYYLSHSHE